MLSKYWKKIGLFILILCCLFNITSKIVKRIPLDEQLIETAKYILNKENK